MAAMLLVTQGFPQTGRIRTRHARSVSTYHARSMSTYHTSHPTRLKHATLENGALANHHTIGSY